MFRQRLRQHSAVVIMMMTIGMWSRASSGQVPPEGAAPPAATAAGDFDTQGSFDAGYRYTSVKGHTPAYRQFFDLPQGVRLLSVDWQGQARGERQAFADAFSISASGLGGDPFPTVQLSVRKSKVYDLRINWRQSRFIDQAPLTSASTEGFNTLAVTDAHAAATVRQIGTVAFMLHPTDRLSLLLNYDRVHNTGTLQTTRALDFVGSPATWGSFARADPFLVTGPVKDSANRATGSLSYSRKHWTVHYKAGYQVYDESWALTPVASPEFSINAGDLSTAGEPLAALAWSQSRHLRAPLVEGSYVARPFASLELRGEHLYYRYQGPFSLDASFKGVARTNAGGTTLSPYDVSTTARGHVREPNQIFAQGATYRPLTWWMLDLDYRHTGFSTDVTGDLGALLALYPVAGAPPVSTSQHDNIVWHGGLHTVDVLSSFSPLTGLTIRPGFRLAKRDVSQMEDGVVNPAVSERQKSVTPELSAAYQPSRTLIVRGSYKSSYRDSSYTRLSPNQETSSRAMVRVEPLPDLSVEADVNRTEAESLATGFVSHVRAASVRVNYAWTDRWSGFAGLSYQGFLGVGNATFLRGVAPLAVEMVDHEIDRVWQGGVTLNMSKRFGLSLTGNFDRTTGRDTITGEPPLYGPVTFPYLSGSMHYDVARFGRLGLDLQRTYMLQELLPLNNFSANLLTIHYIRTF
jgi:hypothetical protein